jgi:hypothetical protein
MPTTNEKGREIPASKKIADKSTGAYSLGFYFNNCLDLLNEVRTACRFS